MQTLPSVPHLFLRVLQGSLQSVAAPKELLDLLPQRRRGLVLHFLHALPVLPEGDAAPRHLQGPHVQVQRFHEAVAQGGEIGRISVQVGVARRHFIPPERDVTEAVFQTPLDLQLMPGCQLRRLLASTPARACERGKGVAFVALLSEVLFLQAIDIILY